MQKTLLDLPPSVMVRPMTPIEDYLMKGKECLFLSIISPELYIFFFYNECGRPDTAAGSQQKHAVANLSDAAQVDSLSDARGCHRQSNSNLSDIITYGSMNVLKV